MTQPAALEMLLPARFCGADRKAGEIVPPGRVSRASPRAIAAAIASGMVRVFQGPLPADAEQIEEAPAPEPQPAAPPPIEPPQETQAAVIEPPKPAPIEILSPILFLGSMRLPGEVIGAEALECVSPNSIAAMLGQGLARAYDGAPLSAELAPSPDEVAASQCVEKARAVVTEREDEIQRLKETKGRLERRLEKSGRERAAIALRAQRGDAAAKTKATNLRKGSAELGTEIEDVAAAIAQAEDEAKASREALAGAEREKRLVSSRRWAAQYLETAAALDAVFDTVSGAVRKFKLAQARFYASLETGTVPPPVRIGWPLDSALKRAIGDGATVDPSMRVESLRAFTEKLIAAGLRVAGTEPAASPKTEPTL